MAWPWLGLAWLGLFCFVLFCFVLFCFVLFCFVSCCVVLCCVALCKRFFSYAVLPGFAMTCNWLIFVGFVFSLFAFFCVVFLFFIDVLCILSCLHVPYWALLGCNRDAAAEVEVVNAMN